MLSSGSNSGNILLATKHRSSLSFCLKSSHDYVDDQSGFNLHVCSFTSCLIRDLCVFVSLTDWKRLISPIRIWQRLNENMLTAETVSAQT